jgi:hypothetical protein
LYDGSARTDGWSLTAGLDRTTARSDGSLFLGVTACSNGSPFICITASLFIINGERFSSGMYVGVENIDGGSFLEEILDWKQMQWKVRKSIRRLIKSIKG